MFEDCYCNLEHISDSNKIIQIHFRFSIIKILSIVIVIASMIFLYCCWFQTADSNNNKKKKKKKKKKNLEQNFQRVRIICK